MRKEIAGSDWVNPLSIGSTHCLKRDIVAGKKMKVVLQLKEKIHMTRIYQQQVENSKQVTRIQLSVVRNPSSLLEMIGIF